MLPIDKHLRIHNAYRCRVCPIPLKNQNFALAKPIAGATGSRKPIVISYGCGVDTMEVINAVFE
jgi:hypothetical protein